MTKTKRDRGFSMIEVLVGLFLVGTAALGLAQLFLVAVTNNLRADRIANATFLAQQQIDWLRGFTSDELGTYAGTSLTNRDETLDLNVDGTSDFRRITTVSMPGEAGVFQVQVYVYLASTRDIDALTLLAEPERYRPQAMLSTIITR